MRHLTSEQKENICHDISSNISFRSIGHKYDISHTTVSRIQKRFCQGGHKSFLVKSRRKKKLEKNEILRMNNCGGRIQWNSRFRYRKFVLQHSQSYFRCPSWETLLICDKSTLEPPCIHKLFLRTYSSGNKEWTTPGL